MTVQEWTIHPDSKLGALRSALEAARTAHSATTQQRAAYAAEVADLDRWINAADETTKLSDYANKTARRSILVNLMSKVDRQMAKQAQESKVLESEYQPLHDHHYNAMARLQALDDTSNQMTRLLSLNELERTKADLTAWMQEWASAPETVEV